MCCWAYDTSSGLSQSKSENKFINHTDVVQAVRFTTIVQALHLDTFDPPHQLEAKFPCEPSEILTGGASSSQDFARFTRAERAHQRCKTW